jgi:DNA-binding NarL/FixJ family response regulator
MPVRVLVVDDYEFFRNLVRCVLEVMPEFVVVGEAGNADEAIRRVENLHPDIVLMDVSMPGLDGITAMRIIKERWPSIKVVVVTLHEGKLYRTHAASARADGFVGKSRLNQDLPDMLRRLAA